MKKQLQKLCLLVVIILYSTFAFGQIRIDWQQCYGSLDNDGGYGIQPFGNGYRVLGTASDASGQVSCGFYHGAWMFDLNSSISIVRQKCRDYAMPSGLLRNSEGETFAVGIAYPSMVIKLWVSKLDETGNDVWSSYLGTEESLGYVTPYAAATNEGGVVAAVSVTEATGDVTTHYGGSDCWVVKLDADGNLEWEQTLGTAGNETPRCLVNMRSGGILVGLTSPQIGVGNIGCGYHEDASILVKLNANGDILRSFCFPGFVIGDVLELMDGYLLAGKSSGNCVLVKCDFYGNLFWTRSYGGSGSESVVRVFEDGPDGYTVFANTTSLDGDVASAANLGVNGDEAGNIWVFHVDSHGDLVWERCLGSSLGLEEKINDVVKTNDREFLLVGNMTWFAEESSGDIHCTNSSLIPNSATNIYVLKVTDNYNYDGGTSIGLDSIGYPCHVVGQLLNIFGEVTQEYPSDFIYDEDGLLNRFYLPNRSLVINYSYDDYPLRPSQVVIHHNSIHPQETEFWSYSYQNEKIIQRSHTTYMGLFDDVYYHYYYDNNRKLIQYDYETNYNNWSHHYSYSDDYQIRIDSLFTGYQNPTRFRSINTIEYNERIQPLQSLTYTYDNNGNLVSGTKIYYSYTPHNKTEVVVTQTLSDGTWVNSTITRYCYDEIDRVVECQNGSWSSENADWNFNKKTLYSFDDEAMLLVVTFKKLVNGEWERDVYSGQTLFYDKELAEWENAMKYYGHVENLYASKEINQFVISLRYDLVEVEFPRDSEWYYEIEGEDGAITYQHLQYSNDTVINSHRTKIVVRTNQIYDKELHSEVSHEYILEEGNRVFWWNKDLQEFTLLYDYLAEPGDEWEIKVGTESIMVHVDDVSLFEYEGETRKMLHISDVGNYFNGEIVVGYGHLTSFFPEKLMNRYADYTVNGFRCYWVEDALLYHQGGEDCDAIYNSFHETSETILPNSEYGVPHYTISPNPTLNGFLTISLDSNPVPYFEFRIPHYTICSTIGLPLLTGSIPTIPFQIDVNVLPAGLYFITIGSQTLKLIKQQP